MNMVCGLVLAEQGVRRMALMGLLLASMAGCATGPQANARDPLEPFNRGVYAFNDAADRAVFQIAEKIGHTGAHQNRCQVPVERCGGFEDRPVGCIVESIDAAVERLERIARVGLRPGCTSHHRDQ